MPTRRFPLINTLLLLILLPLLVYAVKIVIDLRKQASGTPANIVIDAQNPQGNLNKTLWQNLSQGGEESQDMIAPVADKLKVLQPKLIRIDHLFDYYNVDQGNGNYDFSRLDKAVESILKTGALPMLSLSYTTNSMAGNGQNAGEPKDWNQWYSLIKATAKHYSVDKKISGIYYEVWNEPDLFGGWHYGKSPNYLTLYSYTARGVVDGARGTNFKVGGPAITAYYDHWIQALFNFCSKNNLRLDYVSWHKYSRSPEDYLKDFDNLNSILADYPQYFNIERIITEVGPNSEPDIWYDNQLSGVHLISLATQLSGKIHRLFTFEAVDGPTKRGNSNGWGIITHPNNGATPKSRYYALTFLNSLNGQRLSASGDGSWVTSLASKDSKKVQVLLVNYDPNNSHSETFPLTVKNLTPGNYTIRYINYLGKTIKKSALIDSNGFSENIFLDRNSSMILELEKN